MFQYKFEPKPEDYHFILFFNINGAKIYFQEQKVKLPVQNFDCFLDNNQKIKRHGELLPSASFQYTSNLLWTIKLWKNKYTFGLTHTSKRAEFRKYLHLIKVS